MLSTLDEIKMYLSSPMFEQARELMTLQQAFNVKKYLYEIQNNRNKSDVNKLVKIRRCYHNTKGRPASSKQETTGNAEVPTLIIASK